jgi:hypothetical protein
VREQSASEFAEDRGVEAAVVKRQAQHVLPVDAAADRLRRLPVGQPLRELEDRHQRHAPRRQARLAMGGEEIGELLVGEKLAQLIGQPEVRMVRGQRCAGDARSPRAPAAVVVGVASPSPLSRDTTTYQSSVPKPARLRPQYPNCGRARDEATPTLLVSEGRREDARRWLLFYCGRLHCFSDTTRALRYSAVAEELGQRASDETLLAYLRATQGLVYCFRGQIRLGIAEVEQGLATIESLPSEFQLLSAEDVALDTIALLIPKGACDGHATGRAGDDDDLPGESCQLVRLVGALSSGADAWRTNRRADCHRAGRGSRAAGRRLTRSRS